MQDLLSLAAQQRSAISLEDAMFEQRLNDARIKAIMEAADRNYKAGEAFKWDRAAAKRGYWRAVPTAIGAIIGGIYGGWQGASLGAQAGAKTGEVFIPEKGTSFWEALLESPKKLSNMGGM